MNPALRDVSLDFRQASAADILKRIAASTTTSDYSGKHGPVQFLLKNVDVLAMLTTLLTFTNTPSEHDLSRFLSVLEQSAAFSDVVASVRERFGRLPTWRDIKVFFYELGRKEAKTIQFLMCSGGCTLVVHPLHKTECFPVRKKGGYYLRPEGWECKFCGSSEVTSWDYLPVSYYARNRIEEAHQSSSPLSIGMQAYVNDTFPSLGNFAASDCEMRQNFFQSDCFRKFLDNVRAMKNVDPTYPHITEHDLFWGMNTDGTLLTRHLSCWPIFLRLFNLPDNIRSSPELFHNCGLAGGLSDPKNIASFIIPLLLDLSIASKHGTVCVLDDGGPNARVITRRSFCLLSMQDLGANPKTWFAAGCSSKQFCPLCTFTGTAVKTAKGGSVRCAGERGLRKSNVWNGNFARLLDSEPLTFLLDLYRNEEGLYQLLQNLAHLRGQELKGKQFNKQRAQLLQEFGLGANDNVTVSPLWLLPFSTFPGHVITLDIMHIFGNLYGHLYQDLIAVSGSFHLFTDLRRRRLEKVLRRAMIPQGCDPPPDLFQFGGSLKMHQEKAAIMTWIPLLLFRSLAKDFLSMGTKKNQTEAFFVHVDPRLETEADDDCSAASDLESGSESGPSSADEQADTEESASLSEDEESDSEFEAERRRVLRSFADNDVHVDAAVDDDSASREGSDETRSSGSRPPGVDIIELTYALSVQAWSIGYLLGTAPNSNITLKGVDIAERCLLCANNSVTRWMQEREKHVPPTLHHVIHIPECVRRFSNLQGTSLWGFERGNKEIKELMRNPRYAISSASKSMEIRRFCNIISEQLRTLPARQERANGSGPTQRLRKKAQTDWNSCYRVANYFFSKEFDFFSGLPVDSRSQHTVASLFRAIDLLPNTVLPTRALFDSYEIKAHKVLYVRASDSINAPPSDLENSNVFYSVSYYYLRASGRIGGNHKIRKSKQLGIRRGCYATVRWAYESGEEAESLATVLFFVTVRKKTGTEPAKCYARIRWFQHHSLDLFNEVFDNQSRHLHEMAKYSKLGCPIFEFPSDFETNDSEHDATLLQRFRTVITLAKGSTLLDFNPSSLSGVTNKRDSLAWVECASICQAANVLPLQFQEGSVADGESVVVIHWPVGTYPHGTPNTQYVLIDVLIIIYIVYSNYSHRN